MKYIPSALAGIILLGSGCGGATSSADRRTIRSLQAQTAQHKQQIAELERKLSELQVTTTELKAGQTNEAAVNRAIERIAKNLQGDHDDNAAPKRRFGPDADIVYAVPIAGAPTDGRADALITVVKGFEFACAFCHRVEDTLRALKKRYGKDIRFAYKHYIVHPQQATLPAQAACAAAKQGKFVRYKNLLWKQAYEPRDFGKDNLERLARLLRLRMKRFRKDMKTCKSRVTADQGELAKLGVRGTPAFFINGRFISGAQPQHVFEALIDEELAKAKARVKSGTKRKDYYSQWVLSTGKREL